MSAVGGAHLGRGQCRDLQCFRNSVPSDRDDLAFDVVGWSPALLPTQTPATWKVSSMHGKRMKRGRDLG